MSSGGRSCPPLPRGSSGRAVSRMVSMTRSIARFADDLFAVYGGQINLSSVIREILMTNSFAFGGGVALTRGRSRGARRGRGGGGRGGGVSGGG